MSLKNRLEKMAGLEDIPELPPVPADVYNRVIDDNEVTTIELDMAHQDTILDQTKNDLQSVEEKTQYLEDRLEGLESMMNGSRPWNGALAQTWLQDCQHVLGKTLAIPLTTVSGAETFETPKTAQLAMVEGTESIKEGVGKFIAAAKKFFENLFNVVVNFFKGFFNAVEKTERQIDALIEKLKNTDESKLKDSIPLGGWNSYLDVMKGGNSVLNGLLMGHGPLNTLKIWMLGQHPNNVVSSIREAMSDVAKYGNGKKVLSSDDNTETMEVTLAGLSIRLVIPKESPKDPVVALNAVSYKYKTTDKVSTASTIIVDAQRSPKAYLTKFTAQLKSELKGVRKSVITVSEIKSAKAKALAAIDKNDESKKNIALIKAGNTAAIAISKAATKLQVSVLRACIAYAQSYF